MFHLICLRKQLYNDDNVVNRGFLVEYTKPPVQPHEPEKVLDYHDLSTRNHVCCQVLVKWKDRPNEGSTWENISTLKKRFPTFVFEDENSSKRGE